MSLCQIIGIVGSIPLVLHIQSKGVISGISAFFETIKNIPSNIIKIKDNWVSVNEISKTVKSGVVAPAILTTQILAKSCIDNIYDALTNNSYKVGKNTYEIVYTIDGKRYILLVDKKRGPHNLDKITCNGKCVSSKILQYLGPSMDWHKRKLTPKCLGFDELTFTFFDGEVIKYEGDEDMSHIES